MTLASIIAFISFLTAFNVPQPTIDQVQTILMATQATTTQAAPIKLVPVIQTPIIPDQPVYIGGASISTPTPVTMPDQAPAPEPLKILTVNTITNNDGRFGDIDGTMYRVMVSGQVNPEDITVSDPDATLTLYASGFSGNVFTYTEAYHYDFVVKSDKFQREWHLGSQVFYADN